MHLGRETDAWNGEVIINHRVAVSANDCLAMQDDVGTVLLAKLCRPERGGGDIDTNNKQFGRVSAAVLDDGLPNWEDGECCVCTGVNTVVRAWPAGHYLGCHLTRLV